MSWWNKLAARKRLFVVVTILGSFIGGVYFTQSYSGENTSAHEAVGGTKKNGPEYHCPMHPSVVSDKPGICPICHMDLQPIEPHQHSDHGKAGEDERREEKKERNLLFYRHPMRGDITSSRPAKDEMGMDYIPVYEDEAKEAVSTVEGRAGFRLSTERQQLIGVTYAKAKKEKISKMIEATGRVAFDPELYTAIEEYRQAIASRAALEGSSFGNIKSQSNALVQSSKTRLKLLGLSENLINKLGRSSEDPIGLILPQGKAWVYAEVFEYEADSLKQDLMIEAKSPAVPGKIFKGKISSISQVISQPSRTVRIQAKVDDPNGKLRPDTYLDVVIYVDLGENLTIPEESVLFSQGQAYVFVVPEKGRFEPRTIALGEKATGKYVVLSGLKGGEVVVKSAHFLIDSEARLRLVIEKAKHRAKQ